MNYNNQYAKKTIEMYESLLKFRDELSNSEINKNNRKMFRGKTKSYKDNWDKHVKAKGITNSEIDKDFNSVIKTIEDLLSDIGIKEVELKEVELRNVRTLITVLDELDSSESKVKSIINNTFESIADELEEVRINIEPKVKLDEIREIEKNSKERLLKGMSVECINRANRLKKYFNRAVYVVNLLEELC